MIDERRMNDVGTSNSDVAVEPNRDKLRPSAMEASAQTSIPIVYVILPSGRGNQLTILKLIFPYWGMNLIC